VNRSAAFKAHFFDRAAAGDRTTDVGVDDKIAHPACRLALTDIEQHVVEVLQLGLSICRALRIFDHTSVFSEHPVIEVLVHLGERPRGMRYCSITRRAQRCPQAPRKLQYVCTHIALRRTQRCNIARARTEGSRMKGALP